MCENAVGILLYNQINNFIRTQERKDYGIWFEILILVEFFLNIVIYLAFYYP